jgi:hypothetical protein
LDLSSSRSDPELEQPRAALIILSVVFGSWFTAAVGE